MENNKKKILDEINNLYGDKDLSAKELDLIEKVSESDKFTNEAIELMQTQRSKYNDIIPTKENETEDILMIFSDVKNRMKEILKDIQNGSYAKEFMNEMQSGSEIFKKLREANNNHLIEKVGSEIRNSFKWGKDKIIDKSKN